MEEHLVRARVTGPEAVRFERNGATWSVAMAPEVDANTAAEVADALVGEAGDVVAISGGDDRATVVVASDGSTPATEVVDAVLDGFDGGGGGGSDRRAQAGGIGAGADAVVDRLVEVFGPD